MENNAGQNQSGKKPELGEYGDYTFKEDFSETTTKTLENIGKGIKVGQEQLGKAVNIVKNAMDNEAGKPKTVWAPIAKCPAGTYSQVFLILLTIFLFATGGGGTILSLLGGGMKFFRIVGFLNLGLGFLCGIVSKNIADRLMRFRRYVKILDGRAYCPLEELSQGIDKKDKYIVKDLHKMFDKKMFPEGQISQDGLMLVLSQEAEDYYIQYLETKKQQEAIEIEKQKALDERMKLEALNPVFKEAREVAEDGQRTIEQIRAISQNLTGDPIYVKLVRLETVVSKIFSFIQEHPDNLMTIRRFMGHYLPTTLKLVTTYSKLQRESIQGSNIQETQQEILNSMDTICQAFEKLLNDLYEDTAMDISTDISVMKTLFAQEGLTSNK